MPRTMPMQDLPKNEDDLFGFYSVKAFPFNGLAALLCGAAYDRAGARNAR